MESKVKLQEIQLIKATNENLKGLGFLVDDYDKCKIEITKWPKQGWREIDDGTGDEGGETAGLFECWWDGQVLYGHNYAVEHKSDYEIEGGNYILGYSINPEEVQELIKEEKEKLEDPKHIFIWHVNYHPDGGQLFFPKDKKPFVTHLALPGDDIKPEDFKAYYFDGSKGLYIHADIWHDGVYPVKGKAVFKGKQGKVHARVSADLKKEFNTYIYYKTSLD